MIGAAVFLLAACQPDAEGEGEDAAASASGDDSGTAGTADGSGSGSSGEPACEDPEAAVLWAEDGTVMEPMAIADGDALGVDVARSWSPEQGTLLLEFSTECDGPIYLWALVWDMVGGTMDNADSLYFTIDDGDEQTWLYGCTTPGSSQGQWSWIGMEAWTEDGCFHDPLALELAAGDHTILFRNREGGMGPNVAAIGGVVWSHDPNADPVQFLEPPEPSTGE